MGNARVRPARLELIGAELEQVRAVIHQALSMRPEEYSTSSLSRAK
jgi:hypothetical protein